MIRRSTLHRFLRWVAVAALGLAVLGPTAVAPVVGPPPPGSGRVVDSPTINPVLWP